MFVRKLFIFLFPVPQPLTKPWINYWFSNYGWNSIDQTFQFEMQNVPLIAWNILFWLLQNFVNTKTNLGGNTKLLTISCWYCKTAVYTEGGDSSTRKILEGGTTFWWVYMQTFRSVMLHSRKELKMAAENNKKAIWALLHSMLEWITTCKQNYQNYQLVVTPNEMVGL